MNTTELRAASAVKRLWCEVYDLYRIRAERGDRWYRHNGQQVWAVVTRVMTNMQDESYEMDDEALYVDYEDLMEIANDASYFE